MTTSNTTVDNIIIETIANIMDEATSLIAKDDIIAADYGVAADSTYDAKYVDRSIDSARKDDDEDDKDGEDDDEDEDGEDDDEDDVDEDEDEDEDEEEEEDEEEDKEEDDRSIDRSLAADDEEHDEDEDADRSIDRSLAADDEGHEGHDENDANADDDDDDVKDVDSSMSNDVTTGTFNPAYNRMMNDVIQDQSHQIRVITRSLRIMKTKRNELVHAIARFVDAQMFQNKSHGLGLLILAVADAMGEPQ